MAISLHKMSGKWINMSLKCRLSKCPSIPIKICSVCVRIGSQCNVIVLFIIDETFNLWQIWAEIAEISALESTDEHDSSENARTKMYLKVETQKKRHFCASTLTIEQFYIVYILYNIEFSMISVRKNIEWIGWCLEPRKLLWNY